MPDDLERRMPFEGAANFRDLGGYALSDRSRIRWRRLYRSDSLSDFTAHDLERLATLNLHTIVDFRVETESRDRPSRLPSHGSIRLVNIGLLPDGAPALLSALKAGAVDAEAVRRNLLRQYRHYPIDHNEQYGRMLRAIEEARGSPVLIHCVSGKDRTGYGAAVILMALGASRGTILDDFVLSNSYRRDIGHLMPPNTPDAVVRVISGVEPEYLEAAFSVIDSVYGSVDGYLARGLGLSDERRAHLRALLTETA